MSDQDQPGHGPPDPPAALATPLGPVQIAGRLGMRASTVHAVLIRWVSNLARTWVFHCLRVRGPPRWSRPRSEWRSRNPNKWYALEPRFEESHWPTPDGRVAPDLESLFFVHRPKVGAAGGHIEVVVKLQ